MKELKGEDTRDHNLPLHWDFKEELVFREGAHEFHKVEILILNIIILLYYIILL